MDKRRHFMLYAKGWYNGKSDRISDLKTILSEYTGIDKEYLTKRDIMSVLLDLTFLFPSIRSASSKCIDFVISLAPCNRWRHSTDGTDDYDFDEAVINTCISYLALTTKEECDRILDGLGKIDQKLMEDINGGRK